MLVGLPFVLGTWLSVATSTASDSVSCRTDVRVGPPGSASEFAVVRTADGVVIAAHVADRPDSVCRQIGAGILDRIRVTFDYPHRHLILEPRDVARS